MALFGPKPYVNPFGKNVNFSTFWTSCFYGLERRVLLLEYHKRHFLVLYCLKKKKKLKKWQFLDQNHRLTPLEKCQFFDFLNLLFLQRRKACFSCRITHKRHFPGLYCLKKKKIGKTPIFGPKAWVKSFGKMSIFRLFQLLVCIGLKGVFWSQNIIKDIFLVYMG